MRIFISGTVLVCLLALAAPSHATVTSYTSLADWNAAVTPGASATYLENFQGFTTDTSFQSSSVAGSFFTLQQSGSNPNNFRNQIDVPGFEIWDTYHNGTSHAAMYTNYDGAPKEIMSFTNPDSIFAWGADFFVTPTTGTTEKLGLDLVLPGGAVLTTLEVPAGNSFLGFAITGPVQTIDQIVFRSITNVAGASGRTFAVDTVRGASPAPVVPAPGAILLGTIGAGLIGWLRRRRTL